MGIPAKNTSSSFHKGNKETGDNCLGIRIIKKPYGAWRLKR